MSMPNGHWDSELQRWVWDDTDSHDVTFIGSGSSQSSMLQGFKPCEHNERVLTLPNGSILRGYSGAQHKKLLQTGEATGINIITADVNFPTDTVFVNDRSLIPEDITPPHQKVICFDVKDQSVPMYDEEFGLLLRVAEDELKKPDGIVRISCIGGHGRTGTVLAVLYGRATLTQTPIEDIRRFYCQKAVESFVQKKFVHRWLGLPKPKEDPKPLPVCRYGTCKVRVLEHKDDYCPEHTNPANRPVILSVCWQPTCNDRVSISTNRYCDKHKDKESFTGSGKWVPPSHTHHPHEPKGHGGQTVSSKSGMFASIGSKVRDVLNGKITKIQYLSDGTRLTNGMSDDDISHAPLAGLDDAQWERYKELVGVKGRT